VADIANFLSVILSWAVLATFCTAVGGVVFAAVVLHPLGEPSPAAVRVRARTLRFVGWAALAMAILQACQLAADLVALTDGVLPWPVRAFLGTAPAAAAAVRIGLGLAMAPTALALARRQDSRRGWALIGLLGGLLAANAAWLSHAFSRLEHRSLLMGLDAAHQLGAAVWVGGLVGLMGCWSLWTGAGAGDLGSRVLRRFSTLAVASIVWIVVAGLALSFSYVDSLAGLIGTGYGVMILAKAALLSAALLLGAINFLAVRRGGALEGDGAARSRWLVEAEIGLGITILVAAASLTAQPPTADVGLDAGRATIGEVVRQFTPRWPRVTSPSVSEVLASELPADAPSAERSFEHKAWSEYNHNISGLFVVAMGLLACLERTGRAPWARSWPLLFFGLGAFMFFRDDPDVWPLGPIGFWESWQDPEVLQHRVCVLLVVALGLFEWMVRTERLGWRRSRLVFPILCAIGGVILLVHTHGAVQSKESTLIEVTHAGMGVFGVFTAWGRWLEIRLPPPDARVPGWVWMISMTVVGVLLVLYREM
jgi:copper resistance protein D